MRARVNDQNLLGLVVGATLAVINTSPMTKHNLRGKKMYICEKKGWTRFSNITICCVIARCSSALMCC